MRPTPLPSSGHGLRTRLAALAAIVVSSVLVGCAALDIASPVDERPSYDRAGYKLPEGSLSGTRAFIAVVPRKDLQVMARSGGIALRHGSTVNGLAHWVGTPGAGACFITLAADAAGLAALEHELWHCKLGTWHD